MKRTLRSYQRECAEVQAGLVALSFALSTCQFSGAELQAVGSEAEALEWRWRRLYFDPEYGLRG